MKDNYERPKELITGEAKEIGQEVFAAEVKNAVVWKNDEVEMPFRLEEGKPTRLGVFLVEHPEKGRRGLKVKAFDEHFRSALLGRVVFQDKEGRLYRDVDLKGSGGLVMDWEYQGNYKKVKEVMIQPLKPGEAWRNPKKMTWGILDWGHAEKDRDLSEYFAKRELRTHRTLAIIRLDEILDEKSHAISIPEARKKGYVKKDEEPVIAVRAFGTKARISEAGDKQLLEDAQAMVAQELGRKPNEFSEKEYVEWFAETLGKQIARLHRLGYYHRYLTTHNITLDCRIVDFDSARKHPRRDDLRIQGLKKDLEAILDTLEYLSDRIKDQINRHFLNNLFWKGYRQEIGEKFLQKTPAINELIGKENLGTAP